MLVLAVVLNCTELGHTKTLPFLELSDSATNYTIAIVPEIRQ